MPFWKFETLAGLGLQYKKKTFLVLTPFEGAPICSILIAGTQVMLRKAYFPGLLELLGH
jgi:hypothetical protein